MIRTCDLRFRKPIHIAMIACTWIMVCPVLSRADDAVILARVAVAESGWSSPRDRAAIWHVIQRRAELVGWSLGGMAKAYSSPLKRGHWATGADASGRRPMGFPVALSWAAHRDRWRAILEEARAFLRGQVPDPCAGRALHWGDRLGDRLRAERMGWAPVNCGPTRNLFWRP